ncbi:MAG: hypothetical protein NC120_07210 [Ruminococcus sp.]|nr:hypothetical protein [Ruminococcus sp.]
MNEQTLEKNTLQEQLHFEIHEENGVDLSSDRYKQLECGPEQAMYMSAFMQQIPAIAASGALANSYKVVFPEGVTGTLMQYKKGGLGTPIIGENGKIVGHAGLFDMKAEAAVLGGFSVMAAVTGQYFLTEINSKLGNLNLKVDQIMEFLYGDKKAELMSEISFAQQAQKNYSSIMNHEAQRAATIAGLQQSRKTAMQDIEFYMSDLSRKVQTVEKMFGKFKETAETVLRIWQSLDLSKQLFVMSNIMETYFAQNFDRNYIKSVSETVAYYINKCDKSVLGDFRILRSKIDAFKDKDGTKELKDRFDGIIGSLDGGGEAPILRTMSEALSAATASREYHIDHKGRIYLKAV